MTAIAGWRIQVRPQFCETDLNSSIFVSVGIADREAAVEAVRNRDDAEPGEHVFAVRPLSAAEVGLSSARVIAFKEYFGSARPKALAQKSG